MPDISVELIKSLAPNPQAAANAQALVSKRAFDGLGESPDGSILFGRCQGSGKDPYAVSADFIHPDRPVLRCSCPSRQLPCKHALGLLFAYCGGQKFAQGDPPPDILEKREKAEKREAKAAAAPSGPEEAKPPKKTNVSALKKKIKAQMEGLEGLAQAVRSVATAGLAAVTPEQREALEERSKQLGDAYLPGAQAALRRLVLDLESGDSGAAARSLSALRALSRRGLEHLAARLETADAAPDPESPMDEWLGHAWQLSELRAAGLARQDASLLQLSFDVSRDDARREYVDSGFWIDLSDGLVLETRTLRPFKALKHVKADDSFFAVARVPELCVYPGGINPRARWDGLATRPVERADLDAAVSRACPSLAEAAKRVRAQLKNPLLPRNPAILVAYAALGSVGPAAVLEDVAGERIELRDDPAAASLPTCAFLATLASASSEAGPRAALLRFSHDAEAGRLRAQPLALVGPSGHQRLCY